MLQRLLSPIVELRKEEGLTAFLMFAYSFLLMWGYNVIRPITRSAFIKDLGADNLPWMPLVAGFVIAAFMAVYTTVISRLPRRWGLPIIQAWMAAMLVAFWFLFKTGATWVAIAFYLWGLLMGILLTSQFWTLANVTYDPRQAKRLFGFVGAGAPLGGIAGGFMAYRASTLGTFNLVLYSGAILGLAVAVVVVILARERPPEAIGGAEEKGVGFGEALRLLGESKHLQVIAIVISFAAIGANIIEQQLNMAAQAAKGRGDVDALTSFLGLVTTWTSTIAFVIQVWLTSRIHRFLGIGFALMVLPVGFASTAVVMLLNGALWAPSLARVLDQSLRYTVDKTTREILFLPLSADLKYRAKPFVDVTVDRMAKALSGLLMLVLVKPWGLHLEWQQVSYASLLIVGIWIAMALRVKKQYVSAFRNSLGQRTVKPEEVRLAAADLSTVETLVEELSQPDPARVVLRDRHARVARQAQPGHAAPALPRLPGGAAARAAGDRRRAKRHRRPVAAAGPAHAGRRRFRRAARPRFVAIGAINERGRDLACPAVARRSRSAHPRDRGGRARRKRAPGDMDAAETALVELAGDASDAGRLGRRDVAAAVRHIADPRFRRLLIPLLYDPSPEVADEAMESVQAAGTTDFVFVPTLVALLRNRRLKARAREVLVSYGEPVVDVLAHFMRDPEEDIWVRRHIPATLAQMPSQKSVDVLAAALSEPDGFLRYKVIAALDRLRRDRCADLTFPREADRSARAPRGTPVLQLPVALRQPVQDRTRSTRTPSSAAPCSRKWSAPRTGSTACSRSSIPGRTSLRPSGRSSTAIRAAGPARRSTSTTSSPGSCANTSCRSSRSCRGRRRSGVATSSLQDSPA